MTIFSQEMSQEKTYEQVFSSLTERHQMQRDLRSEMRSEIISGKSYLVYHVNSPAFSSFLDTLDALVEL